MNDVVIENFIGFCDNYEIAEEGLLSKVISGLQKLFARLVIKIDAKVKKMKDGKIKGFLTKLLTRAKSGLAKCKHLNENNPELVKQLKDEADDIQEELQEVEESSENDEDTRKGYRFKVNGYKKRKL